MGYIPTEADVAFDILNEKKEPMFYQDLINAVLARMQLDYNEQQRLELYTRLNMDNRLEYQGNGMWYFISNRTYRPDHEEE